MRQWVVSNASQVLQSNAYGKQYSECSQTSARLLFKTRAVSANTTGVIAANYNGGSLSTNLTVRPIGVKQVSLNPTTVVGGNMSQGTVILEAPAAPGPITVSFVSTNHAVAPNPASITIPSGQTGSFTVTTIGGSAGTTTIKATANGITKSAILRVTH